MTRISATPETFTLEFREGSGRRGLPCWLAIPKELDTGRAPLVAVHGIRRESKKHAQHFGACAAKSGQLVIAPQFAEEQWPLYQQVVRKGRADLALLGLMDELRLLGLWQTNKFELSGFSGGAQFAHRFAMLYPNLVNTLLVASAGWYTFPDKEAFPYGLGVKRGRKDDWGPHIKARLHEFLQIPINIAVGELDSVCDSNTRSGTEIDHQQGTNRVDRAHRWYNALLNAAQETGLPPQNIRLTELPDSGHDFAECVIKGGLVKLVLTNSCSANSKNSGRFLARQPPSTATPPTETQNLCTQGNQE